MERVEKQELLDSDDWTDAEIACALCAIRRANRLYGGNRMHKRLFRRVASSFKGKTMQVLEVASAYGDVVQDAALMLRKENLSLEISLLDRSAEHLPKASDWHKDLHPPTLYTGDALAIPMADNSVDVVSCCLFLHHLSLDQSRAFLREALRVARVAVLINDVERNRVNYFLSQLNSLIDPSRLSRQDGPTSVRQAYTYAEMQELLRETRCRFELVRGCVYRLGGIAWKREPSIG